MSVFNRIFLLFLIILNADSISAQQKQKQLFFEDPRAGSFTIFGDIPVTHATGIPDISIPLFTLESHGYKIPITLKYHLAMVKPPYDYTNVATGWVLEAGGTITQEIKCLNDFSGRQPSVFRTDLTTTGRTYDPAERDYMNMIAIKNSDFEHDVYNYTFADKSGKFIVEKNNSIQGKYDIKPLTAESHLKGNVNTTYYPSAQWYDFQNIEITDDQGYNYLFQDFENGRLGGMYSISYFLNQIKTPGGIPLFTYDYATFSGTGTGNTIQNYQITDEKQYVFSLMNSADDPYFPLNGLSTLDINPNGIFSYDAAKTVKKISFENGTLEFTLSANNRYIEGMLLKDKDNQIIKSVSFDIGNFPGQGFRYLNKVYIKDRNQNIAETYELNYNGSSTSMTKNDFCLDYWGYQCYGFQDQYGIIPMSAFSTEATNNTPTSGGSLYNMGIYLPSVSTYNLGTGTRAPNLSQTIIYTLNSIKYPTGGKTEFTYGLNQYGDPGAPLNAGGLRIEKIKNYSADNSFASQKRYEYTPGEIDFSLDAPYESTTYNFNVFKGVQSYITKMRTRSFNYNKTPPVSDNRVRYKHVTEYWENGNGNDDIGKTVYDYLYFHQNLYDHEYNNWYVVSQNDHISGASLDKKTVYKKSGGQYNKALEESYSYAGYELWRTKNVFLNRYYFYTCNLPYQTLGWDLIDEYYSNGLSDWPGFTVVYYDNIAAGLKINQKTTTAYTDNGILTTVQGFEYGDGADKFVTAESITTSDQAIKKITYKYPYSSEYAGLFPYSQMIAKNIITDPVEIKAVSIKSGITKTLSTSKVNFNQFGQDIFRPETVQESLGTNPLETRYRYNYDNIFGNLISSIKENDAPKTYVWGYNKTYPVAEVAGATTAQVMGVLSQSLIDNPPDDIAMRAELDKLRSIAGAMVVSYTYKPLIGITSKTDIRGQTSYYEYDAFNRLTLIRDNDGNVLKRICYNYAGQPENCNYYTSDFQSITLQKNDCGSGYTGSYVTYTVPSGKYGSAISLADANQKAINDLNQNGQAYANANGTCTAAPTIVNLTVFNFTGMIYYATFTNTQTNQNYYFTINSSNNGINLGQIPPGNYNVTISPASGSDLYEWWLGSYYEAGYNTLTLSGINILSDEDGTIQINLY